MACVGFLLKAWAPASANAESFERFVPPHVRVAKVDARPSADDVIRHASQFLGVKYVWGSCDVPPGLDCSGFMIRVWHDMGYGLPRVSRHQALVGQAVSADALQPADLLFFTRDEGGSEISHVGMYIGNGEFIHAASGSGRVVINSLTGYFQRHYSHARRILHLGPGLVVERDQSVAIKDRRNLDKFNKKKAATASSQPVVMGDVVVADEALAEQLRGLDLSDPNQFEHAGEESSWTAALSSDEFVGAASFVGPRFLTRAEHTIGIRTGVAPSLLGPAFFFSPELNLYFEEQRLQFALGFPVPYAVVAPSGARAEVMWASPSGDWRDYTRWLRIARYGSEETALHLELSRTSNLSLREGQLVRAMSPGLGGAYLPGAEFGHQPLSFVGEMSLSSLSAQLLMDDVLDPRLIGAALAYRPFATSVDNLPRVARELSFDAQYATYFRALAAGRSSHAFALEVKSSVWRTSVHDTSVYLGGGFAFTDATLEMGKATLGSLWLFRFGETRAHAVRARVEAYAGRAFDALIDNFSYAARAYVRSAQRASFRFELAYKWREMVEVGAAYVPSFAGALAYDPMHRADKLEAFLALHSLALHPSVRLTGQLLYQGLIFADPRIGNAHYLLADFQARLYRYFLLGVAVRKPLFFEPPNINFSRFEFMLQLGGELSF